MGRIKGAALAELPVCPPGAFSVRVDRQIRHIVQVLALRIKRRAEFAGVAQALYQLNLRRIQIVFRHHVRLAVLFFRFDQPPEFVHRDAGGDFTQNVLARFQRGNRLRHMALHRRCNDDRVDVGFQHIVKHAIAVFDLELIGDAVHTVFVQIADSRHFDIFQCGKACHRGARAGAGNTNFDHVIFSFSGVSNQNAFAVVDFMLYCLSRSPAVCFLACFHLHRLKPNADGLIPLAGARPACQ